MQAPAFDTDARTAALTLLGDGDRVTVLAAMTPQQPDALLGALVREAIDRGVLLRLLVADLAGAWSFLGDRGREAAAAGELQLVALAGAVPRVLAGVVDSYPISLWDLDRRLRDGSIPYDVFVARVQADAKSAHVGPMIAYTPAALVSHARLGLEIAPAAPGDPPSPRVDLTSAAAAIRVPAHPSPVRPAAPSSAASDIGRRVASLVPHGATVQLGLGSVPNAVVTHLAAKRDLGLHSGVLPGAARRLIEAGVATGTRKSRDRGLHVATGVFEDGSGGSWGPNLRLEPIAVTHEPRLLADQERLWAVNSAFEVDLGGLVNAEFAGGARVASAGGQSDFARAAHLSRGGASVLALPSRTGSGRPRIVGQLGVEHRPSSTAADVDYVVTEHGIAELTGATASERAARLVEIAHPDDRPTLRASLNSR